MLFSRGGMIRLRLILYLPYPLDGWHQQATGITRRAEKLAKRWIE